MTLTILLSKPEFWSALFGALAAFLLGALATWWTGVNAKRTAGNLARKEKPRDGAGLALLNPTSAPGPGESESRESNGGKRE